MAVKKQVRIVDKGLYWWSLVTLFLGVILGAGLMWRGPVVQTIPVREGVMVVSGGSGIASRYPDSEKAYQVTIKAVLPRLLWHGGKVRNMSLDKFFTRVWYLDNGERMRKEPLTVKIVLNRPTDGRPLLIPIQMSDPRYDGRARSLLFKAEEVEPKEGENRLSEIPASFLTVDLVFGDARFLEYEYLKGLR